MSGSVTTKLIITGRLPGFNEYSDEERKNRHAGAEMKRRTQEMIGWYIKQQLSNMRFTRPVWLSYAWYEPARTRDKDNISSAQKFVQDALVACGVLSGDGWKHVEGFDHKFYVDKQNPRVEIEITEVP